MSVNTYVTCGYGISKILASATFDENHIEKAVKFTLKYGSLNFRNFIDSKKSALGRELSPIEVVNISESSSYGSEPGFGGFTFAFAEAIDNEMIRRFEIRNIEYFRRREGQADILILPELMPWQYSSSEKKLSHLENLKDMFSIILEEAGFTKEELDEDFGRKKHEICG